MKQFIIFLTLIFLTNTANAGVSPKCIKSVMGKFERVVKNVESALQTKGRPKNGYDALKRSGRDLQQLLKGGSYSRCAKASAENTKTLNDYFAKVVKPLIGRMRQKGGQLCLAEFARIRDYYDKQINQAVASNNAGLAAGKLENLKFDLTKSGKMVTQCKNLKGKVQDFLTGEFAISQNNVANLVPIIQIRRRYKAIRTVWNQSKAAMVSTYERASLDGSQSIADFTNNITVCNKALASLDAAGYNGPIETVNGKAVPIQLARLACEIPNKYGIKKFIAETAAYNKEFGANWQKKWESKKVTSADKKQVYNNHTYNGHTVVPRVKKITGGVKWTYHTHTTGRLFADCNDFIFSDNGKLVQQVKYLCER